MAGAGAGAVIIGIAIFERPEGDVAGRPESRGEWLAGPVKGVGAVRQELGCGDGGREVDGMMACG